MNKTTEKANRNSYTLEDKANAKRYYLIGLTMNEISKLIDAPVRTIEKWQIAENWKQQRESNSIQQRTNELFISGKTYTEIGAILKISKATVWRYLKNVRHEKNND